MIFKKKTIYCSWIVIAVTCIMMRHTRNASDEQTKLYLNQRTHEMERQSSILTKECIRWREKALTQQRTHKVTRQSPILTNERIRLRNRAPSQLNSLIISTLQLCSVHAWRHRNKTNSYWRHSQHLRLYDSQQVHVPKIVLISHNIFHITQRQ